MFPVFNYTRVGVHPWYEKLFSRFCFLCFFFRLFLIHTPSSTSTAVRLCSVPALLLYLILSVGVFYTHILRPPESLTRPHYLAHSVHADAPGVVVHEARRAVRHRVQHLLGEVLRHRPTVQLTRTHCNTRMTRVGFSVKPALCKFHC